MDDHVASVDQHPIAGILAPDLAGAGEIALARLGQLFCKRHDLPGRPPGGDHEVIGHFRPSAEVNRHHVFGLVLIEGV